MRVAADQDPFAGLPDDVAAMLRGYRPLLAAERHGPLIAGLAGAVRPVSKDDVGGLLGALSGLVLYVAEWRFCAPGHLLVSFETYVGGVASRRQTRQDE